MKFSALLFSAIPAFASANVASLVGPTYAELTASKPLVFIKFFAPWCGHCKAMTEDWIQLGKVLEEEKPDLLVAEVDCTLEENEDVCEENGVDGFPTLKYGDPDFLEDYDGSREFDEMYSFATSGVLRASCSPKNTDLCSDEQKASIEEFKNMKMGELLAKISSIEKEVEDKESKFEEVSDGLEEEYNAMMEKNKETKTNAKKAASYDILKAVQTVKAEKEAESGKDEL